MNLFHPSLVVLVACAAVQAQDPRPAAEILREFRSSHFPTVSNGNTPEARKEFEDALRAVATRQCALALELAEGHPDHAQVADVLSKRWALSVNTLHLPERVLEETAEHVGAGARDDVRREAVFARAWAGLHVESMPATERLALIEHALDADGADIRCGLYLMEFLQRTAVGVEPMRELLDTVLESWGGDRWVGARAKGMSRVLDRVGEPIALRFEDLLTGAEVDTADGSTPHTVLVYWASQWERTSGQLRTAQRWAEEIDGVRVVGVVNYSMDGGAEEVKKHLADWGVTFPQLYDEPNIQNPTESPYRTPTTPFFYLLDAEGKVVRFAYRADVMATILRELAAKDG